MDIQHEAQNANFGLAMLVDHSTVRSVAEHLHKLILHL